MTPKIPDMPDRGEIVICRVTKILDYGVFAELLDFEGLSGFVHISQVASSWIKNIRNFVKEGQIRAAKVVNVDLDKKQVDLSLNRVPPAVEKSKIDEWRQMKKPLRFIEIMAKEKKTDFDTAWKEIAEPLLKNYDSLHTAFEKILVEGDSAAEGISKDWLKVVNSVLSKRMAMPKKTVHGKLTLSSMAPDGILRIKKALAKGDKAAKSGEMELYYNGSGKYSLSVTSTDYKKAESEMKGIADAVLKEITSSGGKGEFIKAEK